MISNFLKSFPYLKPVRICNLFSRFLKASDGTMLLLFNTNKDRYELHSLLSFKYSDDSLNAVLPDDMVTAWTLNDYKANNVQRFGMEIEADRTLTNDTLDHYDGRGLDLLQERALTTIEKMIGRDL